MKFTKPFLLTTLIVTLSGCASPAMDNENENAARNRGAVGGALLQNLQKTYSRYEA